MSVVAVSCVVSSLLFVAWCRCMSRRAPLLFAASCSVGALEVVKINLSVKNQHCRDGGIYPMHACIHNIKATTTHSAARAHLVSCFIVMLRVLSTASERFRFRHLTLMNANSQHFDKAICRAATLSASSQQQSPKDNHSLDSGHLRLLLRLREIVIIRSLLPFARDVQTRHSYSLDGSTLFMRLGVFIQHCAVWRLRIAADISRC